MNPFCIPFSIHNMGGALLAMDLGFMGPNYPINTACATGNYCLLKCAILSVIDVGLSDSQTAGKAEQGPTTPSIQPAPPKTTAFSSAPYSQ